MSHKLTSKQIKAIYLLVEGKSAIEVGKKLKLRRETLSRWRNIPEFNKEFERVIDQMREDMRYRLTQLANESINAISYEMSSLYCEPKRLQTSFSVLKMLGIDRILTPNVPDSSPSATKKDTL